MRKGRESRICKGDIGEIRGKNEYRGEKARKVRYGGRKGFQEGRITGEIYSKDVIWME